MAKLVESVGAALLRERLTALHPDASRRRAPLRGAAADEATRPLPEYVAHALARMRLLHDVPFRYLVPDARLLPLESIRFFVLDEAWLDELTAGACAAIGKGSRELARAERVVPLALRHADAHRGLVRDVARRRVSLGDAAVHAAASGARVSGFLLRSALVSGWEGMSVRAFTSDDLADVPFEADPAELQRDRPDLVTPILRLERLSPSVMLALFEGVPRLVWLEEPHHSIQYGFDESPTGFELALRDEQARTTTTRISVPMRQGGRGVVDVASLRAAVDAARPLPAARGSAAMSVQLLQAPSRQRFAASAAPRTGREDRS